MHLAGIPPPDPLATPGDRERALVSNMVAHTPSHLSRSLGTLGYLLCRKNGKLHIQAVHSVSPSTVVLGI